MDTFGRNFKFALRQLARNPGFTLAVMVTLALSIGANTAIFSLVNALMLKSLPYPHPERLGTIFFRVQGADGFNGPHDIDGHLWETLRDNVPSLIAAVSGGTAGVNLQAGQHVQYVHSGSISAHYFDVLGIHPALGRSFTEDEDRPHGPNAAILSYGLWRTTFNADRSLVGQTIHLKGEPFTVVGVLPRGATTPGNADLFSPLQPSREGAGSGSNFDVITRLRDGATWQQADAEINRAWAFRIAEAAKENPSGGRLSWYSVPLQTGQSAELRPKALALMLAAGFILLIACANLAGLTLVRMMRRSPEMATRLALGASRWQIQKQLWVENLLLALAGGVAGAGVGFAALRGLLAMLPEGYLPVASVPLDARVFLFTTAVSLASTVLFGMAPALSLRRLDIRTAMAARTATAGRLRLRQTLIAGEVALTVVLLAAAGLLIRTLVHLETLPAGFNPAGITTAKASLDDARYRDPAAFARLLERSTAAMEQIPAVQGAAVGMTLPFERAVNSGVKLSDGKQAGREVQTDFIYVTPGYFDTLQIPLLSGRMFTSQDNAAAQRVAIVNRSFARKFYPGESPIGHTLDKGVVIVGVVADVQLSSGLNPTAPLMTEETMYVPAAQLDPKLLALVHIWIQPSWIVRTARPVEGLTAQMQRALANTDPSLPFSGFYSMSDLMARTLFTQRIEVSLLGAMAGLALLLSAVGIFALVANMVAQRTREIGIRIALGSSIRRAMAHVGGPGVRASVAGLGIGLLLCAGALRVMRSVLYGVGVYDGKTIAAVALTMAVITLMATVTPALRIARINPAKTLREE
ncbi:MAG TPA: ABC transporter permease [Terracidiphilus sp.]|jgi:predicted permease|nr:ABC transporter permease [Terracidiphilus sp.]